MRKEETKDQGDKAKSSDFGFASMGQGMPGMMSACCRGRDGVPDCSTMIEMMKAWCESKKEDTTGDRRTK